MVKFLTILINIILIHNYAISQSNEFVKSEGITGNLHQSNTGKITFMGKPIPVEEYKESDFLSVFELTDTSDFNIRVYMENSLTNYMHNLAPELSAEELTQAGNYQFTFYADGKLIYKEDLNAGAGSVESKNTKTVFRVPLISSSNEDSWGRFLWNRFIMKGGQDAFTSGSHLLKIEIRAYVKTDEIKVSEIIAEGQINIIVPEVIFTEEQIAVQEIKSGSGWNKSILSFDTDLIRELNKKIIKKEFNRITSIVVIKDGELLIEEYFNNAGRETFHDTRSVGKSFASALTGIAINDKYLKSEDQQLNEFYELKNYSNYSVAKDSVKLKYLLTMSSAFEGSDMNQDSPGNEEKMYPSENWADFTLNLSIDGSKSNGKQWDYFTAGVVLLGDILNKNVPGGLEKYAGNKLFEPLEISNYEWQYTPQKVVNTAGSLKMRSVDLAKFGQLYINKGIWNGKQIIDKDWITKSLTKQIEIPGTENEYYGYLFWNKTYAVNNKNYEVYYSSGNGGNRIIIFKDQPVVIVITSVAYNTSYGHTQTDKIVQNYLIPAIIN